MGRKPLQPTGETMRLQLLEALKAHANGHISKHKANNIEVYLANPVGVGEHPDIIEAIEQELDEIARYNDQVEMLDKYFPNL